MPCCCACKSPVGLIGIALIGASVGLFALAGPGDKKSDPPKDAAQPGAAKPAETTTDPYVLGFKMNRIDGTAEDLSTYKGKVVLMVNVASQCGFTKQYSGLEKLYEQKKDQGFVILGFPANEFNHQEPGTNTEISQFCTSKFGVTFPMFEKIVVKGEGTAPLYKKLAGQPAPIGGEPKWNFTKFLVDRNGNVVGRFESKITPEDKALNDKIDELLKAKPAEPSKGS